MPTLTERALRAIVRTRGYASRWVPTRVGRMHVMEARGGGALPPIVLLHGFSASSMNWVSMLGRLRPATQRIVLVDSPAHGFSDVPPREAGLDGLRDGLSEALDTVIDEPVVLVGNSLGGLGAIRYAATRPSRIAALAALSPAGAPATDDEVAATKDLFRMERHTDGLAFVDRLLAKPGALRHLYAWGVRKRMRDPVLRRYLDDFRNDESLTPDEVGALPMPTLLVWGRAERILPASGLAFFCAHLPPHARIEEPERCGHSPHLDRPAWLARTLVEFATAATGAAREPSYSSSSVVQTG